MKKRFTMPQALFKNMALGKIAIIYAIAGVLWAAFSDMLLHASIHDSFIPHSRQVVKSVVFIIVTSLSIYFLLELQLDAPARKKTGERLRLYAKVFDKNSEGILITDYRGRIISVNPAFTSITGYSEEEIIGQNPNVLKSGLQGVEFYINMWASIHSSGVWQGEIWNRRKNGENYLEWLTMLQAD